MTVDGGLCALRRLVSSLGGDYQDKSQLILVFLDYCWWSPIWWVPPSDLWPPAIRCLLDTRPFWCLVMAGCDIRVFEHLPTGQVAPKLYLPAWLTHLPATWKSVNDPEYHVSRPENELARRASSWQNLLARMDVPLAPGNRATINVAPWSTINRHCVANQNHIKVLHRRDILAIFKIDLWWCLLPRVS